VLDGLVGWPLLAGVLWLAAKLVRPGALFVDFLWAVGVARVPLVACAVGSRLLIDDPAALTRSALEGKPDPALLWVTLLVLPALGWLFLWLYSGYRVASGASGVRAGVSFVAAVIVAEVLSKPILVGLGALGA
jgi:hypothetical protein